MTLGCPGDVDTGEKTGNGWTWTYNVLKELTASGVLKESRAGGNKTWTIVDLAGPPRRHDGAPRIRRERARRRRAAPGANARPR